MDLICVTCPRGCHLSIDETTLEVTGNSCPRGVDYAVNELKDPKRTITTTVAISGAVTTRCPVRSSVPISKKLMKEVVLELKKYSVSSPVKAGDILVKDIFGSGADIIITRSL